MFETSFGVYNQISHRKGITWYCHRKQSVFMDMTIPFPNASNSCACVRTGKEIEWNHQAKLFHTCSIFRFFDFFIQNIFRFLTRTRALHFSISLVYSWRFWSTSGSLKSSRKRTKSSERYSYKIWKSLLARFRALTPANTGLLVPIVSNAVGNREENKETWT